MSTREAPTRGEGFIAYVLSALTTLLWVACVLPAGYVGEATAGPDAATPVHREAVLLVPALLLLVVVPVGCTLARRASGLRAVLAGMDGFVVGYVAIALVTEGSVHGGVTLTATVLLFALSASSFVEAFGLIRPQDTPRRARALSGARLAVALLVLFLPLHVLRQPGVERASLLAPFLFVAVSAGGARLAQGMRGIRRTAGIVQVILAVHVLITLRYTIQRTGPAVETVNLAGEVALGLAVAVVLTALVQVALLLRRVPEAETRDGPNRGRRQLDDLATPRPQDGQPMKLATAIPLSPPVAVRDRLRLIALLGLVALWTLPVWAKVQVGDAVREETGAMRTGVIAALALIALWGLSSTSLAARTLRGLRIGGALTDALLALTTAGLLVGRHAWIPGGELREAWVPIFGPLALLAVLDAVLAARRPAARYEVSVIRAGAALFAAGALAVDGSPIPAGIATWLGLSPLMFLKLDTPRKARRSLEAFLLVAASLAGLAPWLQRDLVGVHPAIGTDLTWPVYLWCVTAALVVTTALDGVLRPEAEPRPGG